MPSAIFDSFDNLDQINIEDVARWLKPVPPLEQLENYLANRILYPQTVPLSKQDIKLDLAILREALRLNGPKKNSLKDPLLGSNPFLNVVLRKVLIPRRFLDFSPDLISLVWAFLDGLLLFQKREDVFQDVWVVVLTDDADEVVGSIILPRFNDFSGLMEIRILEKIYQIKSGSLSVVPCNFDKCEISFKFKQGKILGKEDAVLEVYGGKLGIMIDGRIA